MDGWRGTDLLSGEWNPAYWHLLWFLLIPPIYLAARWLYVQFRINAADEPVSYLDSTIDATKFSDVGSMVLKAELEKRALDQLPTDPADPFALARRAADVMKRYPGWWCVCGGWAVDLHLGRLTREHEDIEIAVLRREQYLLREYLIGWQPQYVIPGQAGRIAWQGEELEPPIHELHTRPPQRDLTHLELLLNEDNGDEWLYRRDERVRMPLARSVHTSPDGVRYLAPEIVLLYKSKYATAGDDRAAREEQDFASLIPTLDEPQRDWLRRALELTSPGHPWSARLNT